MHKSYENNNKYSDVLKLCGNKNPIYLNFLTIWKFYPIKFFNDSLLTLNSFHFHGVNDYFILSTKYIRVCIPFRYTILKGFESLWLCYGESRKNNWFAHYTNSFHFIFGALSFPSNFDKGFTIARKAWFKNLLNSILFFN